MHELAKEFLASGFCLEHFRSDFIAACSLQCFDSG